MSNLLSTLLKWLGNKLAFFLAILFILVVAAWIKREWSQVSARIDAIKQTEKTAARYQAEADRLDEEVRRLSGKLTGELMELDMQSKNAWLEASKADKKYKEWQGKVGWYQYAFEKWKVLEMQKAYAAYVAKRELAKGIDRARELKRKAISDPKVKELIAQKIEAEEKAREAKSSAQSQQMSLSRDPTHRVMLIVRDQILVAFLILLGVILSPVLIKAFLYYLIAPAVKLLPPVRILPAVSAPAVPHIGPSAVSHSLNIKSGEELLVHQDYLQSADVDAIKTTRWFLNHRIPFSSIAAGMAILTRIRPRDGMHTRVVVSPLRDPLGEIGVLTIPEGAAMVIQPRSLAGVIKEAGKPIAITRHWRLFSAHAWVTLQLRYLVFHGPCRVILKGCRGVCAEEPRMAQPRQINQDATIGFSANLEYRNVRCETFVSYLLGKEPLFNDMFGGGQGIYAYEQMPSAPGKDAFFGRGIEGFIDATMKVFGI